MLLVAGIGLIAVECGSRRCRDCTTSALSREERSAISIFPLGVGLSDDGCLRFHVGLLQDGRARGRNLSA
jgi:hypothetical protein